MNQSYQFRENTTLGAGGGGVVHRNNSPSFRNTSLLGKGKRPLGQADSREV